MKNIIFIFYIVSITLFFLPQKLTSQIEYRNDSIQHFNWDNSLGWQLAIRDHYFYDNGGINFTSIISIQKDFDNSLWLNNYQQIRTYNVEDKLDTEIFQLWNETQWLNNSKSEYTYDASGNNNVIIFYSHNGAVWSLVGQELKTYNDSNLVTESISQLWDLDSTLFKNTSRSVNTYSGKLFMQQDNYNWNITEWNSSPYYRAVYTYNGTLLNDIMFLNDIGSGLNNQTLVTYSYINDNFSEVVHQDWKDLGDGSFGWVNSNKQLYTYDINEQLKEIISYSWNPLLTWDSKQKSVYFISEGALSLSSVNLIIGKAYPNPFINELNITLKSSLESDGIIQIFDINGKELSKTGLKQGVKSIKMNNNYLTNGVYFVKVTSKSQSKIFKVIKK